MHKKMRVTALVQEETSIYFSKQLSFYREPTVPNIHVLVQAVITQKMMRRKDAECNWMESP